MVIGRTTAGSSAPYGSRKRTRQAGVQQQYLSKSASQNEMQRYYDSLYSNMNQVNLKQCWSACRQRGRKMKSSDFDDLKKDTKGKLCWTSSRR